MDEKVGIIEGPIGIQLVYIHRAKQAINRDKEITVSLDPEQFLENLPKLKEYFESRL